MQEFYIRKGATLPYLRMELINDGRYDFHKSYLFNNAVQACTAKFFMKNTETGILKISNAPVSIVPAETDSCEEKYILQYEWKERDTKEEGSFEGWFELSFQGLPQEEGVAYPEGTLKMPIEEDLLVVVK